MVIRSAALATAEAQARAQAAAQAHQKAEQAPQLVPAKPAVIAITLNLGNDFALQGRASPPGSRARWMCAAPPPQAPHPA